MFLIAEINDGLVKNIVPTQLKFPELGDCQITDEFALTNSCLNVIEDEVYNDSFYNKIDVAPFIQDNKVYTYRLVEKSEEERQQQLGKAVSDFSFYLLELSQQLLDDFAKTRRYDSILSAISYLDSDVEAFKNDAIRCKQLRDLVWTTTIGIITASDFNLMPVDEFKALLPELIWNN